MDRPYQSLLFWIGYEIHDYANKILKPIIVFTDVMVLIVYSTKELRKHSMSFYFCLQAFFDIIMLTAQTVYSFIYNHPAYGQIDFYMCFYYFYYILDIFQFLHTYLIILATIDRLLFIIYPKRFDIVRKFWFQCVIVGLMITFSVSFYVTILYFFMWSPYWGGIDIDCYNLQYTSSDVYIWIDIIGLCIIPVCFMLLSSLKLILVVRRSRSKFKKDKDSSNSSTKFAGNILAGDLIFLFSTGLKYSIIVTYDIPELLEFFFYNYGAVELFKSVTTGLVLVGVYGSPFFVHLITNKIFQKIFLGFFRRLFNLFKLRKAQNSSNNTKETTVTISTALSQ